MHRLPQPLPPLQTLRAYESACRLGSFTRAAEELNVTQSAVSRQIRYLEARLGMPLFIRLDRGVRTTAAGQRFASAVSEALQTLAQATSELIGHSSRSTITVGATNAIASLWLMPRLSGFRQREPESDIRVLASDQPLDHSTDDVDVVIEYRRRPPESADAIYLFNEQVLAVCGPTYLHERQAPDTPDQLLSESLLQLDVAHIDWMDWAEWLGDKGVQMATTRQPIRVNNYAALLQAAIAGQGVALGWRHLVEDYLTSGALVQILPEQVIGPGAFWLTPTGSVIPGSAVDRLCQWLQDAIVH